MTRAAFEDIAISENNEPLVDLSAYPFVLEMAYYNQGLSNSPKLQIRQAIAEELLNIQNTYSEGYVFKIWDAHRPREVQDAIYNSYTGKALPKSIQIGPKSNCNHR